MKTKIVSRYQRLAVILLLLLTTFVASPAQADESFPDGIIVASSNHTCAIRPDGSVDCWGLSDGNYGRAEDQPGPYIQISAGNSHNCGLTPSGAVDCWGLNSSGQAEDQPGPYTHVNAGQWHTCALTLSGSVDCWGFNYYGQVEDRPGPYTQVSAGYAHTCALTSTGSVDCWGGNENGQAEDQAGPYTQVSTGYAHTCALTPTGSVDCWGDIRSGAAIDQPGPYTHISAGAQFNCGLTPSAAVDCWGHNTDGQAVDQPGPYTRLSAGWNHACALMPTGAVDCWGFNNYGQAEDQSGPYGPDEPIGDTTPPVVTVTGVTEGSTYILGAVPQAGCSTTDEGSGVAVEASLSLSGGNALGVGSFTATCSGALDNAGNNGNTAVVHYNVNFQFTGFSAPVDNPPILNIARAGQVIPLKWRLTDVNGSPVTNLTNVTLTVADLSCEAEGSDSIEEYAGSNSGLQNLGDGYYQWNWKTSTSYANSCKTFSLDLGEGGGHTTLFQFKK